MSWRMWRRTRRATAAARTSTSWPTRTPRREPRQGGVGSESAEPEHRKTIDIGTGRRRLRDTALFPGDVDEDTEGHGGGLNVNELADVEEDTEGHGGTQNVNELADVEEDT